MASSADRDPAPAVTRALRILTVLAESDAPLSLSELARTVGLAKSSTANLCAALEEGGMISRDGAGFRLGRRTAELGGAFALQFNQIREFFAVCEDSPVLRREVVQIAMLDGTDALYLARHEGRAPHRLGTPLGSRLPAALTGSGRAILATWDDEDVAALLRDSAPFPHLTDQSLRTLDDLLRVLAEVRRVGYSVDESGSTLGITGIAVALSPWTPSDPPLAMGAAVPSSEATPERIARVGEALLDAAARLTNPLAVQAPRG